MGTKGDITVLLDRVARGDAEAQAELIPHVYRHLKQLASHHLRREGVGHTLQPTALVHEAYLRLINQNEPAHWSGRGHFFAVAARIMRNILVDHARAKKAQKRGAGANREDLDRVAVEGIRDDRVLVINDALLDLANLSPRQSQIVEMRFFGGLTEEEVAVVLGLSERTVKRDWAMAKAWLHERLAH